MAYAAGQPLPPIIREEQQDGVVRIGNGAKLHPAIKTTYYREGGFRNVSVTICCQCPDTANGRANHRSSFYPNLERTCRI